MGSSDKLEASRTISTARRTPMQNPAVLATIIFMKDGSTDRQDAEILFLI